MSRRLYFALVDEADGFAFAARDALRRDEVDSRVYAEEALERVDEFFFARSDFAEVVAEHVGVHLDVDVERVGVVDAVDDELVVRRVAVLDEDGFDLRREDVDALDDEHVVAAAHRLGHADVGAAAGAFLMREDADVARAVAHHREGLFVERGEYELALLSVGKDFAGVRVYYFRDELVLADVHSALLAALVADARAFEFGEAVDVVGLDAEVFLDVAAHLFAPRLRAEDSGLELDGVLEAALDYRLADVGGV